MLEPLAGGWIAEQGAKSQMLDASAATSSFVTVGNYRPGCSQVKRVACHFLALSKKKKSNLRQYHVSRNTPQLLLVIADFGEDRLQQPSSQPGASQPSLERLQRIPSDRALPRKGSVCLWCCCVPRVLRCKKQLSWYTTVTCSYRYIHLHLSKKKKGKHR